MTKKWVVVHDGWDEACGFYRTFFVRRGYFSDKPSEAKKLSWVMAKLIARKYARSTFSSRDKYFAKRAEEGEG